MTERGFVQTAFLIGFAVLGLALWMAWGALQACNVTRAEQAVVLTKLSAQVREQNLAVTALEKAGAERAAKSQKALTQAQATGAGLEARIAALKAEMGKPRSNPTACAAADGVRDARKALKP